VAMSVRAGMGIALAVGGLGIADHLRSGLGPRPIAVPVVALGVAAGLMAVPYATRWGGSRRQAARTTLAMWALLAIPFALVAFTDEPSVLAPISCVLYALAFGWATSFTGRYAHADRPLASLDGEPRAIAEGVLDRAGLAQAAVLVAPMVGLNALAVGLVGCVLVVDRRAASELRSDELAALVAHEAAHVRQGDVLVHHAVLGACVTVALVIALVSPIAPILTALALWCAWYPAVAQRSELRADRFAARLAGTEATLSMLERIHADQPERVARVTSNPWLAAYLTHPPYEVRQGQLREHGPPVAPAHHRAALLRAALAGVAVGVPLAWPHAPMGVRVACAVPAAMLFVAAWTRAVWAVRASYQVRLGLPPARSFGRARSIATGALLVAVAGANVAPPLVAGIISTSALLAWLIAMRVLRDRPRRTAISVAALPPRLRRAVGEAQAALSDDEPQRGLAVLDAVVPTELGTAWHAAVRGQCLMHDGRWDEAREALEAACDTDPEFVVARASLVSLLYLMEDWPAASEAARALSELAPADPTTWAWKGFVHLGAGDVAAAQAAFDTATALHAADAHALAGLVHVAIDRASSPEEVAQALDRAIAVGPRSPSVLLAHARCLRLAGREDEARTRYEESIAQLAGIGSRCLAPSYERRACAWGIIPMREETAHHAAAAAPG